MSVNLALMSGVLATKPKLESTKGKPIVAFRLRTSVRAGKDRVDVFEIPFEAFYDEVKSALLGMEPGDGIGFAYETHCYNGRIRETGKDYDKLRLKVTRIEYHWPADKAAAGAFPKPKPAEPEEAAVDLGDVGTEGALY